MSVYPTIQSGYNRQEKTWLPTRLHVTNVSKRRNLPSQGLHNSRFSQQTFSCTETRQKVAACDRPQCPEQLYASTNVQNGNGRDYQKLPDKRRMASFDRSGRCVLSCAHTSGFSTFATLPCRQENVPIQSSAIRVSNGTPIIYADCKRGKAHSSVPRNSSSPIPGRLVVKGKHQCQLQTKELLHTVQQLGTVINFLGYHFVLQQGKVFPTEKKLKILQKSIQYMEVSSQTTPRLLMPLIGVLASLGKDYTNGSATHTSPSMVSQNKLAISPVTRSEDSSFKPLVKTSSVVERSK